MARTRGGESLRWFAEILLKGQQVDWKYSLVVVLVITGMFATPLALGSIRNRVYVAVKAQIEKENNAREVSLQVAREEAPPLDDEVVTALEARFPGLDAVGNHKLVVSVEGQQGADLLTLQTLVPNDPRTVPLQIVPGVPAEFGMADLVVSDALGRVLYGQAWDQLWSAGTGNFRGDPLSLRINDLPLRPAFRVVARRRLPGRGLYGSSRLGAALRRYTQGFGAPELGLPLDEGLAEYSLPRLTASRCVLLLPHDDPSCAGEGREQLFRRLGELQLEVEPEAGGYFPPVPGYDRWLVRLTEIEDQEGKAVMRETGGSCREILAPQLVTRCGSAVVLPELTLDLTARRAGDEPFAARIAGADPTLLDLLPEATRLQDLRGAAPPSADGAFDLAVPVESGLRLGEALDLQVAGTLVPARVQRFYACAGTEPCPLFADPLSVFRLENLAQGTIRLASREPLAFVPAASAPEYDEILAYVARVEEVEAVSRKIQSLYPGYTVQYNVAALDKLRRQDSRFSALFSLTIVLSALFLVLALSALSQINIERRRRQIAQMLILGLSRAFVRRLVVGEYLFLTGVSSLAALGLTSLLCLTARSLLHSTLGDGAGRDFQVIVDAMGVDPRAFFQVFAVVAACTWAIALLSAWRAAQSDPLKLLD
jgi:FtsX-like permease family